MNGFTQGLLFGAISGGLIGLLNTPHSGNENRRRIREYIQDNTASVEDLSGDLKGLQESLLHLSNEGMAVLNTATKEVTESIDAFTRNNQPRIRRISERVSQLTEDMETEAAKYEDSPLLNKE